MDLSQVLSKHHFCQQVRLMLRQLSPCAGSQRLAALKSRLWFTSPLSLDAPEGETGAITKTADGLWQIEVQVHGLTGALGALPAVYTEWLIGRYYRYGDTAAKAFLDMFNNRLYQLRYQAWLKYHFCASYENSDRLPLSEAIRGLAGVMQSAPTLQQEAFAGFFANPLRSLVHLENWLSTRYAVPVSVTPFTGGWQEMSPEQCCCLGRPEQTLGQAPMIGRVCLDMAASFTVTLGPLRDADRFLPEGDRYNSLWQSIRDYVGPGLKIIIDVLIEGGRQNSIGPGNGQLGRDLCLGQPGAGYHRIRLPAWQEKEQKCH
ncbi:type VI secretion system baseplate subunit TssG [Erwinia phyllosphaerae]|uniref:type VI secretion system baseplate subunit TssG n=1 Tax=Erwinia phyllosphaerae TaxID=2853256 RepID=UPI001FED594C|nr:type VI secretion system baseplate subunit TssG [Erwinia phyllosphaerae]